MKRVIPLIVLGLLGCGGSPQGPSDESTGSSPGPTGGTSAGGGNTTTTADPAGTPGDYEIGAPVLADLWVNPAGGSDSNTGASSAQALHSLTAAWNQIPMGTTLGATGYRIRILSGTFSESQIPNYWESRYGTSEFPVIVQAETAGAVTMPSVNIFDCRYLYFLGLRMTSGGGDVVHFDSCQHMLLRQVTIVGTGNIATGASPQEALKVNQSHHLYVEDCDISGGWDNAVDCVAVQYGHFFRNAIHHAGDWCMYLKGGSAYFRVEGNEYYDGGTGGFTAGQGTGFEFMTSPWLHYEAYDIKFVNNVVHDTHGAGFGVNGGYNILLAFNTLYRVGENSHVIEVVYGSRSCDGNVAQAQAYLNQGGWGTTTGEERIPDRNVYILNNIVYNPSGYQSQWQQFAVYGPQTPGAGSNIPNPVRCDTNLVIRGNIIWNGPAGHPLGLDDTNLDPNQILADNAINTIEPQLINPAGGNFRPTTGSNVTGYAAITIPNFSWSDAPTTPAVPQGTLDNSVPVNRDGINRASPSRPGAY